MCSPTPTPTPTPTATPTPNLVVEVVVDVQHVVGIELVVPLDVPAVAGGRSGVRRCVAVGLRV